MLTIDDVAEFCWVWNHEFFLRTDKGNFVWSHPEYPNGNNTIVMFEGTLDDFCKSRQIDFVRCEGVHVISHYCGADVTIVE
jgi:hypothetical protein